MPSFLTRTVEYEKICLKEFPGGRKKVGNNVEVLMKMCRINNRGSTFMLSFPSRTLNKVEI